MANNVQLVQTRPDSYRELSGRGGAPCPVPNVVRSGCFCTRGAMQDYDGYYLILALAKTVTPGGSPRREPGLAGWFLPGGFSR